MTIARWMVGAALMLLGSIPIVGNWWFIASYVARGERRSVIPLVGGLLVSFGLLVLPLEGIRRFWWLPLLCDYGTIALPIGLAASWWHGHRTRTVLRQGEDTDSSRDT
jgi:hypothetical protein